MATLRQLCREAEEEFGKIVRMSDKEFKEYQERKKLEAAKKERYHTYPRK